MAKKWSKKQRSKYNLTIQQRDVRHLAKLRRKTISEAVAVEVVHPKGGVAEDVVEDLLDILWKCLTIEMKISLFKNMPTGV